MAHYAAATGVFARLDARDYLKTRQYPMNMKDRSDYIETFRNKRGYAKHLEAMRRPAVCAAALCPLEP
jgi:hypothetical protein